jgi:hypothetical protein
MTPNTLNFQVSNKATAILKSSYIIVILLIISSVIYSNQRTIYFLPGSLVVIFSVSIYLWYFADKQSIKSVKLVQNKLIVKSKRKETEIPISEIVDISDGINLGFDLKLNLIKTYTILLKGKYPFGNKILLDYKISQDSGITVKSDPIAIAVLKIELSRIESRLQGP